MAEAGSRETLSTDVLIVGAGPSGLAAAIRIKQRHPEISVAVVEKTLKRPEVKADKLGCYGHSMGSTHTWLVGPFEPRLEALVGNCCLPTYAAIHRHEMLHCFPNFIPGIYRYGDTPDIAGLIAPRPLKIVTKQPEAFERTRKIYRAAGAEDKLTIETSGK